jgi:beta-galactosidase
MYASIPEIEAYLANAPKPYMLCEFIHSMGNGPGDIEDYFECIYAHDRFAGGFVWEWCDHAVYRGITADGRKIFHYGGDSGEYPHDNNFCVDGMVSPDRSPHPALAEYKNVIRPVRAALIDAAAGIVELENKLDFTNLSAYVTIRAELLYDGEVVEAYDLGSVDLAPHGKALLTVPYNKAYLTDTDKTGSVTLKLIYIQSAQRSLTPKGHTLGFDQLFIKAGTAPFLHAAKLSAAADISFEESNAKIIITGADFTYVYNKLRAAFDSMVIHNRTILTKPAEYNIWRAPVDNDRNIRSKWENARFHRAVVRVYETGIAQKEHTLAIRSRLAITAIQNQHILDLNVVWHIAADGTVTVEINGKRNKDFPFLPRFGLRFFLPGDYSIVNYLGYGPKESYIDKRRSSWYGRFTEAIDHMYVDYIKPQENSSHYHCDEVTLLSSLGNRIRITAAAPFSFQTGRYTQEELTAKAHNYELRKAEQTILCLDYKMSGVGSNSCGPELDEKYQLCEEEISFTVTLQMDDASVCFGSDRI